MSLPTATAGPNQVDIYSSLPRLTSLSGSGTPGPILEYEWTILSVAKNSTANVGTNGDFTNGIASIANPQFTCDKQGSYVLQLKVRNIVGWSDPDVDMAGAQTTVFIKTEKQSLYIPGTYEFDYDTYLNDTLYLLEDAISSIVMTLQQAYDGWNGTSPAIQMTAGKPVSLYLDDCRVAYTEGFSLVNPTEATAEFPVQGSPAMRFAGSQWDGVSAPVATEAWLQGGEDPLLQSFFPGLGGGLRVSVKIGAADPVPAWELGYFASSPGAALMMGCCDESGIWGHPVPSGAGGALSLLGGPSGDGVGGSVIIAGGGGTTGSGGVSIHGGQTPDPTNYGSVYVGDAQTLVVHLGAAATPVIFDGAVNPSSTPQTGILFDIATPAASGANAGVDSHSVVLTSRGHHADDAAHSCQYKTYLKNRVADGYPDYADYRVAVSLDGAAYADVFTVQASGEFDILNDLSVTKKAYLPGISSGAGTYPAKWTTVTGQITYDTSDARQKFDVHEYKAGLDSVCALQPRQYIYKGGSIKDGVITFTDETKQVGLIAQEVYEILPDVVFRPADESNEFWNVDYPRIVPALINCIKELNEEIKILKDKVLDLSEE